MNYKRQQLLQSHVLELIKKKNISLRFVKMLKGLIQMVYVLVFNKKMLTKT